MVLIARHILGVQPLDSPYKMIAADVNNSGSVSTIDLVELRKLILFISTDFPNNTSWRFLPMDFVFPDDQNPWSTSLPDICTINTPGVFEKTFIGIKTGDVNLSAFASDSLITDESHVRNSKRFKVLDQTFQEGEKVIMDLYMEDVAQLAGLQFSLEFDKEVLDYNKIKPGSLKDMDESCIGLAEVENGLLHMAWVNMKMSEVENTNNPLFSLEFTALQSGTLSEVFSVNSDKLKPELYTPDLETFSLGLHFSRTNEIKSVEVGSLPNPFQEQVNLTFEVQESGQVSLRLLDINGRLIYSMQQEVEPGVQSITLNEEIFPANGIYIYELSTKGGTSLGQLIKQE